MEILLGSPRGFCAGVVRAIDIVEIALRKYGAPVYVRHEIVHNQVVVEDLKKRGAIFVEELSEVPDSSLVIFSAHGVSPSVQKEADMRNLSVIDATCPLVTKVHSESKRFSEKGYTILLVGHKNHPEIVGTYGEAPEQTIVIENKKDAYDVQVPDPTKVVILTQTTLSVSDTQEIADILVKKFPSVLLRNDICYATSNRQETARELAQNCDIVLVIGAKNSSNCNRLKDVIESLGVPSQLLMDPKELDLSKINNFKKVGIISGASTPESLVSSVVEAIGYDRIITREIIQEDISFSLPRELRESKP
ncbi:MAG: 4-hydroxy-3-methylbut-2-enyl diphosphate reductase [Chloroflexi bacterium]|nr:4-hydroxy-3-methylbut-2-enyl diphosphate reductase [Chloroflexota bacterium]|tara:strand:+ start:4286 stop:5203 length:918 start_codon:yes stop_codon:yes gene_type:complete